MISRSSTCLSSASGGGGRTLALAHLRQDDALLLVEVVLRQRLVVDDGDHAVERHRRGGRARRGRGSGAQHGRARIRSTADRCRATSAARARRVANDAPGQRGQCNDERRTACHRGFVLKNSGSGSKLRSRCRDRRIVGAQVSGHRAPQEIERAGAHARQSVQLELHEDRNGSSVAIVVVNCWPTTRTTQHPPLYSSPTTASSVLRSGISSSSRRRRTSSCRRSATARTGTSASARD